jgi:hypothetical protein
MKTTMELPDALLREAKAFRDLEVDDELRRELRGLNQRVEAACERVNPEDWR